MSDWKKLRELAEAATPGPWKMETGVYQDPDGDDDVAFARGPMCTREPGQKWDGLWRQRAERNARYIAAANPQTVIALLDEIEKLRTKVGALLQEPFVPAAQLAAANAEIETVRRWLAKATDELAHHMKVAVQGRQQLAAAIAAKNEACELLQDMINDPSITWSRAERRLPELRKVGAK